MQTVYNVSTRPLRDRYQLTQRQLSVIFRVPLRTVQNWESRSCCPIYVYDMMLDLLARGYRGYRAGNGGGTTTPPHGDQ